MHWIIVLSQIDSSVGADLWFHYGWDRLIVHRRFPLGCLIDRYMYPFCHLLLGGERHCGSKVYSTPENLDGLI